MQEAKRVKERCDSEKKKHAAEKKKCDAEKERYYAEEHDIEKVKVNAEMASGAATVVGMLALLAGAPVVVVAVGGVAGAAVGMGGFYYRNIAEGTIEKHLGCLTLQALLILNILFFRRSLLYRTCQYSM